MDLSWMHFLLKTIYFVIIYRTFLHNIFIITFERHIFYLTSSQKSSKRLAFAYITRLYISITRAHNSNGTQKISDSSTPIERRSLSCTCPSKYYMMLQAFIKMIIRLGIIETYHQYFFTFSNIIAHRRLESNLVSFIVRIGKITLRVVQEQLRRIGDRTNPKARDIFHANNINNVTIYNLTSSKLKHLGEAN